MAHENPFLQAPRFRPVLPSFERESRKPGLIALSDGVRALLPALGVTAAVTVTGWAQRQRQDNQGPGGGNRVSFMPGRDPSGGSGAAGGLSTAPEQFPTVAGGQCIAVLGLICTVSIWAADASSGAAIVDEEAQFRAWMDLFQATVFAMHAAVDPDTGEAVGNAALDFGSMRFTKPPTNVAFGLESLLEFTQFAPILAPKIAKAYPQVALIKEPMT